MGLEMRGSPGYSAVYVGAGEGGAYWAPAPLKGLRTPKDRQASAQTATEKVMTCRPKKSKQLAIAEVTPRSGVAAILDRLSATKSPRLVFHQSPVGELYE